MAYNKPQSMGLATFQYCCLVALITLFFCLTINATNDVQHAVESQCPSPKVVTTAGPK